MDTFVSGRLAGIEDTKVSVQLRTGEIKTYPRKELEITLQWVFENMGQPVICQVRDGFVRKIEPLRETQ